MRHDRLRSLLILLVTGVLIGGGSLALLRLRAEGPGPEPVPAPAATPASQEGEAPYPYCWPDAKEPPPDPDVAALPSIPPPDELGDIGPAFEPFVDAIVEVTDIEIIGPGSFEGLTQASVTVSEVLFETENPKPAEEEMLPIPEGPVVVSAADGIWVDVDEHLASGGDVVFGLQAGASDGAYNGFWAIEVHEDGPEVLRGHPYVAQRDTSTLRLFLGWEGNPAAGLDAIDLIVAWNVEADTAKAPGPIQLAWDEFVTTQVIHGGRPETPRPGTPQYWAAAPPECRTILDAPDAVLEGLEEVWVWIHVPEGWMALSEETVLCLRMRLASAGCTELDLDDGYAYVDISEAYAIPGEPMELQLATIDPDEGATSWVRRTTLATLPWSVLQDTGVALVELDQTAVPTSYAQVEATPQAFEAASVRGLTVEEHEALLDGYPDAVTDDDP